MAKWHCGTSDWHIASRVPGPNGHLRRGAPKPNSFRLCSVLQSSAYALGITERCAVTSSRPTVWRHCSHSDLGRATSSIRPDMIFGRDTIAPASPWQNGFAERLIGSIRREFLDHLVILSEAHLRRTLQSYASYYNKIKTHRSLDKDAPAFRPVQRIGNITSQAILGGLHHQYVRI